MQPSVSVIIPVYNVRSYICECLDSLVAQDVAADVEILLVDDHGSDDSMAVAQRHVEGLDSRLTFRWLATPSNGGPGAARNAGLDAANGDYVAFVDPDDVVAPDFLSSLLDAARSADADIAYCQLRYRGGPRDGAVDGNPVVAVGTLGDEIRRRWLRTMRTFCVTFLYRRAFLSEHGLRFPPHRSSEDTCFLLLVLLLAQRVACADRPLYYYCVRDASLTTSPNPQRYRERFASMSTFVDEARQRGFYANYSDELEYLYAKKAFAVGMMDYLRDAKNVEASDISVMRHALDEKAPLWKKNALVKSHVRLLLAVVLLRYVPVRLLYLKNLFPC